LFVVLTRVIPHVGYADRIPGLVVPSRGA
jgi:hypothetical protein